MQELSWRDVETYLDQHSTPTAVVPIGSTEQHGPHLPLGVDAFQARDIAEGIAESTNALATPPIWYGDANHHLGFPGTVSLSPETVVAVLGDVYASLAGHGFENVVTVNGHRVANLPAIQTAMKEAAEDYPEVSFVAIDPLRIGMRLHRELRDGDPEDGMHGGEFETSFMLARYPDLVDEDSFVPETSDPPTDYHTNDLVTPDDRVLSPSPRHTPENGNLGHVGDPTMSSAEKGETIYEGIVEAGIDVVTQLIEE
nr:creatininase family protein [Halalkalicoccus sp. NIPERK01]